MVIHHLPIFLWQVVLNHGSNREFVSSSEAAPRNSEKAPAAPVTISTLSEVFLQNHASLLRLFTNRKPKNAMN
jgi:hypothetical protein